MKKPKPPETFEEVREYIREKRLCVEPEFFFEYFEVADWYDSEGKPVLSWKQKALTWHRKELQKIGKPHPCILGCKNPGVYIAGRDDAGYPYFRCIDHKPRYKPFLPEEYTNVFKTVHHYIDLNERRNQEMRKLKGEK